MELTRRDALLALAGGGVVASASAVDEALAEGDGAVSERDVETLTSAARVLYPDEVEVAREFVETSALGLALADEGYLDGLSDALDALRTASRRETGRRFASLDTGRADHVLRATGADMAYADPEGTTAQRVRYYVVDGLLYALYAAPKGAGLVGNPNPKGYPGGTEHYQRPPEGPRVGEE